MIKVMFFLYNEFTSICILETNLYILPCSICFMCVFLNVFSFNLYLYNTALSVLFCVNKDIIIINIIFFLRNYGKIYY